MAWRPQEKEPTGQDRMFLVPTKTSLEERRWNETQECMRAMGKQLSECVWAMEMQLSIETQERHEELLVLQSRVYERWEDDRFECDINNLEKVFKRIEKNQDAFKQRVTQQLQELNQEQQELYDNLEARLGIINTKPWRL